MVPGIKEFAITVFQDYKKRFGRFWIILYVAAISAGIVQHFLPYLLPFLNYRGFAAPLLLSQLRIDFFAHPFYFPFLLLPFLISLWGYASLYFSFSGTPLGHAVGSGIKNLHRYLGFVVVASLITVLGFIVLIVPLLLLLNPHLSTLPLALASLASPIGRVTVLPVLLVGSILGIYLLVSFAIGPFILLFVREFFYNTLENPTSCYLFSIPTLYSLFSTEVSNQNALAAFLKPALPLPLRLVLLQCS